MEIFLGSHHFLLIMKHTPPPLFFPASAVLSIRKTEKLSDGVTAVSGTVGVSHVSVKQRMLQSLMSRWKLILALRSSILFSKDWTLASRILGSFPQSVADSSTSPAVFLLPPAVIQVVIVQLGVPKYLQWPRWVCGQSVLNQVSVALSNVQKCSFVVHNHCSRYTYKEK